MQPVADLTLWMVRPSLQRALRTSGISCSASCNVHCVPIKLRWHAGPHFCIAGHIVLVLSNGDVVTPRQALEAVTDADPSLLQATEIAKPAKRRYMFMMSKRSHASSSSMVGLPDAVASLPAPLLLDSAAHNDVAGTAQSGMLTTAPAATETRAASHRSSSDLATEGVPGTGTLARTSADRPSTGLLDAAPLDIGAHCIRSLMMHSSAHQRHLEHIIAAPAPDQVMSKMPPMMVPAFFKQQCLPCTLLRGLRGTGRCTTCKLVCISMPMLCSPHARHPDAVSYLGRHLCRICYFQRQTPFCRAHATRC